MKLLPFILTLIFAQQLNAQLTITRTDLKFELGNQWNKLVFSATSSSLDLTVGNAKSWDFTSYSGGKEDTTKVLSNDGSTIIISSTSKNDITYKLKDSTYTMAYIAGVAADDPYAVSVGLPHRLGKKWSGSGTALGGLVSATLNGEVLAEGQITTPMGTHNCLLVKEAYSGALSENNYYWETKEYGRVAVFYESTGELFVMQSDTTPTTNCVSTITITKKDLQWEVGRQANSLVYTMEATGLDVASGDDKNWDFTAFTGGIADTGRIISNDGAILKMNASSKIEQWFGVNDSSYSYVYIEGSKIDTPYTSSIGLPHENCKKWFSTGTVQSGAYQVNLQGEVIASGKVKIPLGTFDCLLVREKFSGAAIATNYYWETKEHGRVAAHFSAYKELYVLQDRKTTTNGQEELLKRNNMTVYPNPSNGSIAIKGSTSGQLKQVYDLTGRLLLNSTAEFVNVAHLPVGLYMIKVGNEVVRFEKN